MKPCVFFLQWNLAGGVRWKLDLQDFTDRNLKSCQWSHTLSTLTLFQVSSQCLQVGNLRQGPCHHAIFHWSRVFHTSETHVVYPFEVPWVSYQPSTTIINHHQLFKVGKDHLSLAKTCLNINWIYPLELPIGIVGINYLRLDKQITPPKFNSSPMKLLPSQPNRKGLSSNHHFSGASC